MALVSIGSAVSIIASQYASWKILLELVLRIARRRRARLRDRRRVELAREVLEQLTDARRGGDRPSAPA